jgi:hypothetical protein
LEISFAAKIALRVGKSVQIFLFYSSPTLILRILNRDVGLRALLEPTPIPLTIVCSAFTNGNTQILPVKVETIELEELD